MIEASYPYLLHHIGLYFRAFIGFPGDLKEALQKMDNLTLEGERMTRATVDDNLADTELRPPVERGIYRRGNPNVELRPHNTPTSMPSATAPSITEVATPTQAPQLFQGASNVIMDRNQINISSVQYGTRPTSKGDL